MEKTGPDWLYIIGILSCNLVLSKIAWRQARHIWITHSGENVRTLWAFAQVFGHFGSIIYGCSQPDLIVGLTFGVTGLMRSPWAVWTVVGLHRTRGFTSRERRVAHQLLALLALMVALPLSIKWVTIFSFALQSYALVDKIRALHASTKTGALLPETLYFTAASAVLWTWLGYTRCNWIIFGFSLFNTAALLILIVQWHQRNQDTERLSPTPLHAKSS